jgi:60 kDa SS-A/Ro ribonucleoprotein
MVKYRQRDGWTHADMLRLAHPKPATPDHDWLYGWAVDKKDDSTLVMGLEDMSDDPKALIGAFKRAQVATTVKEVLPIIKEYRLTREMIPTQFLKSSQVWEALFNKGKMPTHALVRNLGNMSASGFLTEEKFEVMEQVTEALVNEERIRKSRLHPLAILQALKMYAYGQGRHNEWQIAQPVVNALDKAFYLSFGNIEPTGKKILLACDVSGSMSSNISGSQVITCAEGVGVLSMVTAATEKYSMIRGFTAGSGGYGWRGQDGSMDGFIDLNISPGMRLTEVMRNVRKSNFGSTDCALPMMWALANEAEFDAFVVLTDNETWAGSIHPTQAIDQYNREMGRNVKLVVVSMTANDFSIADPDREDMLDVVGFDTSTPAAISNFLRED